MGDVKLNSSGGGSVTLTTPSTASNLTVTLPSASGTLATTSGSLSSPTITGTVAGGATYTSPTLTGASITAANSNTVEATSGPTSTQLSGNRNKIINGACAIFQRGTNLSTNNSQGYYVDRWWGFSGASTAATYSQVSSTGLAGFPYAVRAQRNSGNTGTAGVYTGQIVESNNLQDLQGQSIAISFWARAGANYSGPSNALTVWLRTGTVADQGLNALISPTWTGAADQTSNVTLTTSWQKFTVTGFTVGSTAQELTVFFSFAGAGTAGTNDYFDITGLQLERGATATPFESRLYGTELTLCQRYFQVYVEPRARGTVGASGACSRMGFSLPVTMRSSPTSAFTGTLALWDGSSTATLTSITLFWAYPHSVEFEGPNATGSMVNGRGCVVYIGGVNGTLSLSSEL